MTGERLPDDGVPTPLTHTPRAATQTAVIQLVARAVSLAGIAASTALVTRRMGNDFTDWATVLSCVGLVGVILEPGITPLVARRLALDPRQAPTPASLVPVRLALGIVSYAIVLGLVGASRGADALPLAAVLGAQVFARALINNAVAWLQVDQRLHRLTVLESCCTLMGLGALIIGVRSDASVPVLGALAFTGPLSVLALLTARELRLSPSQRAGRSSDASGNARAVVREALPLTLALILTSSYTRTSIAFVNGYENDARASRFFFGFLFAEQLIGVAGVVAGALLPLIAARSGRVNLLADDVTHRLLIAVTAAGALCAAALIGVAPLLTLVIGGPDLDGAEVYLALLAPLATVIFPAMTLGYVYISMGRGQQYLWFALTGLAVNLALNFALTPTFGARASAHITWATELSVMAVPLTAVWRSSSGGRRSVASILVLVAVSVAAADLAARGPLPYLLVAALLIVAVAALAHGPLRWFLHSLRRPVEVDS